MSFRHRLGFEPHTVATLHHDRHLTRLPMRAQHALKVRLERWRGQEEFLDLSREDPPRKMDHVVGAAV